MLSAVAFVGCFKLALVHGNLLFRVVVIVVPVLAFPATTSNLFSLLTPRLCDPFFSDDGFRLIGILFARAGDAGLGQKPYGR